MTSEKDVMVFGTIVFVSIIFSLGIIFCFFNNINSEEKINEQSIHNRGDEIVSKRTYDSKTYDNDGLMTFEVRAGHIHYKDEITDEFK